VLIQFFSGLNFSTFSQFRISILRATTDARAADYLSIVNTSPGCMGPRLDRAGAQSAAEIRRGSGMRWILPDTVRKSRGRRSECHHLMLQF